ncbi:MAG: LysR substrate-binding domain-containing protein [Proteobacteria bacterium]|nr:LysR substrate-binding domain-containing protein [Pseudomonadota bacterium]MDA1070195.1 LysR substrate-binding domain-containing protein [Pseudomonadota bacterium]
MIRKQLNLHALRAFEAAARLESFKGAAAELGVTPVAITRHIRTLEGDLRVQLFERLHRGVRLTEVGLELREEIVPAFAALDRGVEHVRERRAHDTLRIGSEAAFAKRWLAPRLEAFHALHPEVHVDLRLQEDDEEVDGIIFYGFQQRFGRNRHLLFNETAFPVCSPALLEGSSPLVQPSDLSQHCLLHDDSDDWWQRWFETVGLRGIVPRSNETFFSHDRIYEAAIEGWGVMIGDDMVYGDDLAEGRLVRLFDGTMAGNQFILTVRSAPPRRALESFVDWILSACSSHKKRMQQVLGQR